MTGQNVVFPVKKKRKKSNCKQISDNLQNKRELAHRFHPMNTHQLPAHAKESRTISFYKQIVLRCCHTCDFFRTVAANLPLIVRTKVSIERTTNET